MTLESSSNKETFFAAKYGKKGGNTISQLIQKKQEKQNMTGTTLNESNSFISEKGISPEKSSKSDLIYLVKGVDDDRNAWYYVLVERLKLSLFLKALNDPIIHLENYCKVLYSAYGDEPPKDITDKLKDEYGIK